MPEPEPHALLDHQDLRWLEKARGDLGLSPSGISPEQVTRDHHPLEGCALEGVPIGRLLGVGSFAVVFELLDPGHPLAIKVMPRTGGVDAAKEDELFQREVQIGLNLRHPNIAHLHRFVELPQSRFVVLDRLEGETMASLTQKKISVAQYRELFAQLAEGLAHAHSLNVLHRDLKPENVMIGPDRTLKILDFGMARVTTSTTTSTQTGQFKGTPMYCAPEQIINSKAAVLASDQFAFGLLSYQLLTGEFPYTLVDSQPLQTLFARLQYPAAKLSDAWPEVGQAADEAMARMLAMKPEERFPSIEEAFQTFSQALPG